MWIKICGLTTPEAVDAALDARVDAVGFVFAESVRRVTPEQAERLARAARGRAVCVAVTRHPTQQDIDRILSVFKPDALQTDVTDFQQLDLPAELTRLPVLRGQHDADTALAKRILFEGHTSGAGIPADWVTARSLARRTELVLAGGLNAANVATAIAQVQPFGVDVSSGVEERPGIKNSAAIHQFAVAARQALRSTQELV